MTLRDSIRISVVSHPGIKGVELALQVMGHMDGHFDSSDYFREIESMIQFGEIMEVEYTLPTVPNKIKSSYYPAGTILNVKKNDPSDFGSDSTPGSVGG